jgi:hypothetical protein
VPNKGVRVPKRSTDSTPDLVWRKSSASGDHNTNCLEAASWRGALLVHDSKHPEGPTLVFSPDAWHALLIDVKRSHRSESTTS